MLDNAFQQRREIEHMLLAGKKLMFKPSVNILTQTGLETLAGRKG